MSFFFLVLNKEDVKNVIDVIDGLFIFGFFILEGGYGGREDS